MAINDKKHLSRSTMKLDRELKIEIVAIVREELEELLKQKAENGSDYRDDKELLERMIRVEVALVHQGKIMEQRFEVVDKRFEAVDKRFEDMYKYVNKGFSDLKWFIMLIVPLIHRRYECYHSYPPQSYLNTKIPYFTTIPFTNPIIFILTLLQKYNIVFFENIICFLNYICVYYPLTYISVVR